MTTFDDLTFARSIMADREMEAGRARLARIARAAASCREGRSASLQRLLARSGIARPRTAAGC